MKMNRREFLFAVGGAAASSAGWALAKFARWGVPAQDSLLVDDLHSKLNLTKVKAIIHPRSLEDILGVIHGAKRTKDAICIAASRHAMGGQQFADGALLIDTRGMHDIIDLDTETGLVEVEAGIEWPEFVDGLQKMQLKDSQPWTIPTKQTGADRLSLGGAISANAHGRTLTRPPFVSNIESLLLVNGNGDPIRCSRTENPDIFRLAIGGYGLIGVVHSAVIRLERRHKLTRKVEMVHAVDLPAAFKERINDGYTLGDWQYVTDENSSDFLNWGVFSCYRPVEIDTPIPEGQDTVSDREWDELVYLAHTEKSKAFKLYSDFYLKTDGQIYWSDTSQLGAYARDYHVEVDKRMHAAHPATEMITEIDVPQDRLVDFLAASAAALRDVHANDIYGTIRLAAKDSETFLPWAKGDFACVIFNLHVEHTHDGITEAAKAFQKLIDLAIERDGSYYLTYHRWARKDQVLACYPQFPEFLKRKSAHDPDERFQSNWYRYYKSMFA
jgi:FAD/FMN-containing dehydrogenase